MGRVERYFQHNLLWWIKKKFNPTHMDQIGPIGWTYFLITIVWSYDTQAHLGLGLQPDNMAHTIPKPKS